MTGESAKAENHADRAEFIDARKNGTGESTRYSSTLLQKTMYSAIRLADGSILRIAVSRATVGLLLIGMLPAFLLVLLAALILSAVLASGLAKRIVEPTPSSLLGYCWQFLIWIWSIRWKTMHMKKLRRC